MKLGLRLSIRPPTFGDVKTYRRRKGKEPSKVVFIMPHTNEHPAVFPFQKALSEKLTKKGKEIEKITIDNLIERCWRLREKLIRFQLADHLNSDIPKASDAVTLVLTLQDYLIRVKTLRTVLQDADKEKILAVELHSMIDKGEDDFFFDWGFRRIKNTKILVQLQPLENMKKELFDFFERLGEEEIGNARIIASLANFELDESIDEFREIYKQLKPYKKNIKFIEIPSKEELMINRGHRMHSSYYSTDGFLSSHVSVFERGYSLNERKSIGVKPEEVEMVSSILVI
ncbi:hypothetical protein KAW38_02755 [Candidatus Micrarchaeota archaeon]|nr:hypothetical protein [Candidatus Micrarchaeota archaeon]